MFGDPLPLFFDGYHFLSYVLIIILGTCCFIPLLTKLMFTPPLKISPPWLNINSTPNSKVFNLIGDVKFVLTPLFSPNLALLIDAPVLIQMNKMGSLSVVTVMLWKLA